MSKLRQLPAIHRLHLAHLPRLPAFHPLAGERCDVYAYLVAHPDGPILVDTGVGEGSRFLDEHYRPEHRSLADALAAHGVAVESVRAVVNSHLHFDHCGRNALFPGIPVYVQRAELEAARQPGYTVREWFDAGGARLEALDGDREIAEGVRLLATPGHTPGHQSLVVEAANGRVLVCAQAAYTAAEFAAGGDAREAAEGYAAEYRESLARLRALRPERVCFSHDAAEWRPGKPAARPARSEPKASGDRQGS